MATDKPQSPQQKQQQNQQSTMSFKTISKKKIIFAVFCLFAIIYGYQIISKRIQLSKMNSKQQKQQFQQKTSGWAMIEVPPSPSQKQVFFHQNLSNQNSNSTTKLKDYLNWSIDPLYKTLDFDSANNQEQNIIQMPVMISVTSQDIFQNNLKENMKEMAEKYHWTLKYLPNRPSIDLICVIDVSTSMLDEEKIDNVKKTLKYMLNFLREDDRLSLITFNHQSEILLPLTKFENIEEKINNIIDSLQAWGNTNIFAGMENAFKTIKQSVNLNDSDNQQSIYKNRVASILLLSDGQDNTYHSNLKGKIQENFEEIFSHNQNNKTLQNQQEQSFSINSFGYGKDHDSHQLSAVAEIKNGNFFYVSEISLLKKYFLSVFGSLATTLCTDMTIEVKLKNQNFTILKTYGEFWEKVIDYKNQLYYQIKQSSIEYGKQYNFVFDLLIPTQPSQYSSSYISYPNQLFLNKDLQVKFQCIPTRSLTITDEQIFEEMKYLNISKGSFNQQLKSWDYKVQKNLLRMKAVEIIDLARKSSENDKFDEAKLYIQNITKQFEKFERELSIKKIELNKEDQKEIEAIKGDLSILLQKCEREKFATEGGKHEFQDKAKKYQSKSYHPDKNQVYENQIQEYYNEL